MARQRPLREVCNARADTPRLPAFACNWYREYEAARGEHASLASTVARRKLFCDGLQALLLALDGSSAPQAHMQHSVDIRTALAVQRRVIDQLFASSDGLTNCATLFTHITEHNLRQPWALTLQMHALVLDNARLLPDQRLQLGAAAIQSCAAMDHIAAAQNGLTSALLQGLRAGGSPVQQETAQHALFCSTVAQLQSLQQVRAEIQMRAWRAIICCDALQPHQRARIQLSWHPSLLTDMCLLARLLAACMHPVLPMQHAWLLSHHAFPDLAVPLDENEASPPGSSAGCHAAAAAASPQSQLSVSCRERHAAQPAQERAVHEPAANSGSSGLQQLDDRLGSQLAHAACSLQASTGSCEHEDEGAVQSGMTQTL